MKIKKRFKKYKVFADGGKTISNVFLNAVFLNYMNVNCSIIIYKNIISYMQEKMIKRTDEEKQNQMVSF